MRRSRVRSPSAPFPEQAKAAAARRTLLFCFLVALCEGLDLQAAGVAAGGLSREFMPTAGQKGLFFSASTFGLSIGAVIGGWLADRIGRKKVLIAAIGAFGLFSLLTIFAWDMQSLTIARLLTGLGLGGALPNLVAVAAETSVGANRNASIATMYIGMPLGGAVASLIILVTAAANWRSVFVSGGIAPLVIVPFMAAFMPEPPGALIARRSRGVSTPPVSALRELFGRERIAGTLLLWMSFFLALLILYLLLNWLPTLLEGRGMSRGQAAGAQIGFNLGGAACALLVGTLLDTQLRRVSIVATFVTLTLALLALGKGPAQSGFVISSTLLLGGSVLAAQTILYAVAAESHSAANRGTGVGAAVAVGRVGSIAGPLVAALLIGTGRTPSQVLTGILPVVIACAIGVTILGWRAKRADT